MLNQCLFEDQEVSAQMSSFSFPSSFTFSHLGSSHQTLKGFALPPSLYTSSLNETLFSSTTSKQRDDFSPDLGRTHLLSLQRSSANLWAWGGEKGECLSSKRGGGDDHLGVSAMKMKKMKSRRKVREPRFCFKTMSDVDVLDDGYKWRKYGQKVVKNTQHPRSYYRCTQDNCRVKKRVERLAEDPRMVITTYEGRHAHSPSQDLEDSQPPSHLNNFFF
ncbi:hypothetical protein K2173_005188 [Erythroxylum novogranatense]|uniref:WRKY domain-containing protein n=1 Tax=Erythroxylum novogranatense TaxID=1862640 RepID=A0AAV8TRK7_9ROSI|nr:hypothetical protein K2173_005188 [Erythroxylum novogranatense]